MHAELAIGGFMICRPKPISITYGCTRGFTLMSDLHIGAAHVDYKKIEREIAAAVENKDRVNILGDVLDLILCQDKKRFSPDTLHPKLQGRRDIVNAAIEWAADLLEPAADLIDMIALGNHETAVEKYSNFDPTQALIYELNKRRKDKNHVIHYGGYTGFIDYRFRYVASSQKEPDGKHGGFRYVIYYHHGSGATAPVTKGLIDFNRRDVFIDADLLWLGHKHNRLTVAVEKLSCPKDGWEPKVKDVRHVMTGAYFDTYRGQTQESVRAHGRRSNYAADAGMAPQGKGGARVELIMSKSCGIELMEVRVIQ